MTSLLAIIANSDLQHGFEFDCSQEYHFSEVRDSSKTPIQVAFSADC